MTLTAKQAVMLSVAEVRERAQEKFETDLDELDRWYESGKRLTAGPNGDLMRKEDEAEEDWRQRVARMANLNVLARIVDAVGGWIYSSSPKRSLGLGEAGSDAQSSLEDQLRRMRYRTIEREQGVGQALRGKSITTFGWRAPRGGEDKGGVVARVMRWQDVFIEYAPDDPSRATLMVFRVANESATAKDHPYWYRIWTDQTYHSVDSDWNLVPMAEGLAPTGANPFRMIPAVELDGLTIPGSGRCLSLVRDVVGQQRLILNKISDLDQLVRYQSGDVFVVKGKIPPKVTTGAMRFINLPNDPNSDAFFASPGAKIAEALEVIKQTVEWSFQTCGLPVTVLIGDQAESGYALRVRYQQAESLVKSYQERAVAGEEHAVRVICAVGRYGRLALPDPWSIEPRVEFSSDIFPSDEDARRLADARDVAAGLMTNKDFWRRNRKDIPEDQLDNYAAEVAKESAARQAATNASFGFAGAPDVGVAL